MEPEHFSQGWLRTGGGDGSPWRSGQPGRRGDCRVARGAVLADRDTGHEAGGADSAAEFSCPCPRQASECVCLCICLC